VLLRLLACINSFLCFKFTDFESLEKGMSFIEYYFSLGRNKFICSEHFSHARSIIITLLIC